MTMTSIDLGQ